MNINEGESIIKKTNPKYKEYHKRRRSRLEKHKLKREGKPPTYSLRRGSVPNPSLKYPRRERRLVAPRRLNIVDNHIETLGFFKTMLDTINSGLRNLSIFCDLADVEEIKSDAIMYLIALMENAKNAKKYDITIGGNLPKDMKSAKILHNVGFFDYVTERIRIPFKREKNYFYKVRNGNRVDPEVPKELCKIVCEKCNLHRVQIQPLTRMLGEMLTNTVQHAYNDSNRDMLSHWYVFMKEKEASLKFVFLDTGLGIPETIRRNFIKDIGKSDADLIESAFIGEDRTSTRKVYRGKGLPCIMEGCEMEYVKSFIAISGKGRFEIKRGKTDKDTLLRSIVGTLYVWEINKMGETA